MHKDKAVIIKLKMILMLTLSSGQLGEMSNDSEDFKSKFQSGAQVLQRLFESGKSPLSDQFLRWKLWAQWEQIVGKQMASVCEPVGLSRGVLKIWVKNSAWHHQLQFFREEILKKIQSNESYAHMENLVFTLDRRSVPEDGNTRQDLKRQLERE